MNIYKSPRKKIDNYGRVTFSTKQIKDFEYLIGKNINDIILFDNGTDEMIEQKRTILPRFFYLFVGNKDGEMQLKPFEFDQYRIVVSTIKDIIVQIESIG